MQFSPSLWLRQKNCTESILKPLLATKYFTCSLQRCSLWLEVPITDGLLQGLSKVRSLTKLDLDWCAIEHQHLEIIINSFPSLETLTIRNAERIKNRKIIPQPPHVVTKRLRSVIMRNVDWLVARSFIPMFSKLRKLELGAPDAYQELNLSPLSSSLPLLTDLTLEKYDVENTEPLQKLTLLSSLLFRWCCFPDNNESIKHLVQLSSLQFYECRVPNLDFLTQENSLRTFYFKNCFGFVTSTFASLAHAPTLHVLKLSYCSFNTDCLHHLENMIHLRKLDLISTNIVGDSRSLKTLMQNLFQLEELNLCGCCDIGDQGAIAGALYSTHSRLRVLNLYGCGLVDDDLNGIGALKNTLEVLDLSCNRELTSEALVFCKDLVKLKSLVLARSQSGPLCRYRRPLTTQRLFESRRIGCFTL